VSKATNSQPTAATRNTNSNPGATVSPLNAGNSLVASGQAKLQAIGQELNALFVERDAVIKNALRALVVGQSMLLLGPPGTGKSALSNELCSRIVGGNFFSWLLNRTSDPAEILGPYSLKAMERDQFLRKVDGKLPTAHIAFLDEIFKCNEPTLNILLPLINEKVIFNDGKPVPVPLISLFAASNELPDDESLTALYDRLVFRMYVDYVRDAGNKQKMYERYLDNRSGANLMQKTTITLDELKAMQDASKSVVVSTNVLKNFLKLLNTLGKQGIVVSDRRQNECLKIMQGSAILEGRDQVTLDDLAALVYVLWENQDDIDFIESEVLKLVNPYDDKFRDLMKKFNEIKQGVESADPNDKAKVSIEAKSGIENIVQKFGKVIDEAQKNGKDVKDQLAQRDMMIEYNQKLIQDAIGLNSMFGSDVNPF
jgi:MoxR-like ATPase